MPLVVKRTQHAIGQGGFHSSYLYAGDKRFGLVFDCGGATAGHRARVIGPVVEKRKHDWLVISHLDKDHINGVSQLESAGVTFSNVFLPHVDLSHQLFLMLLKSAGTARSANANDALDTLLIVGRLYAGAYGRVRVVVPGDRRRNGPPPQDTFPNPDGPEHTRLPDLTPNGLTPSDVLDHQSQQRLGPSGSRTYDDTQSVFVTDQDWELRFYSDEWAFPDPVTRLWSLPVLRPLRDAIERLSLLGSNGGKDFTNGVDVQLNAKVSAADANVALTSIDPNVQQVNRQLTVNSFLKKLYLALPVLHDYNSASLCLYSGPALHQPARYRNIRRIGPASAKHHHLYGNQSVGWLGMGDAHLGDVATFKRFSEHYQGRFGLLSTLVLPHHGSRYNYDNEQIQLHRLLALIARSGRPAFIAASDPGHQRYAHPHQEVVEIGEMYGEVYNVNLNPNSAFGETIVEHA